MEKLYRLPKEFAEQWVAALRSGEFKQGVGNLFFDNSYCSIGVGAKICGASDYSLEREEFIRHDDTRLDRFPMELKGEPDKNELVGILTDLNDSHYRRYTFPEIADWVEANVEFYPTPTEIIGSPIELS